MIEKTVEMNLLYDFYSALLPQKQQDILRLYYEEDCSLTEIAEEVSITRQGVHDAMKKAERALHEYEEKLGLVGRSNRISKALAEIDESLKQILVVLDQEHPLADTLHLLQNSIHMVQEDQ